jgi:lipopolysaccharide/colanic/teichoic acid biosynthesis glycosyltransferase
VIRIFKVLIPASVLALFLVEAVLIFACFAAIPYFQEDGDLFLFYESGWQQIAIAEALILLGMYFSHLYDDLRIRSRIQFLQQLSLVIGVTFIAQALLSYWNIEMELPRSLLIPGSALALVTVFACRILFSRAIQNKVGGRRLLFIGLSPTVVQLAKYLRRYPEFGLIPIGYLDHPNAKELADASVARLGPVADLPVVMDEYHPDWLVVGRQEEIEPRWLDDFIELRFGGMHTEQAASLYETTLGRVCASEIRPAALIFSDTLQPNPFNLKLQSLYSKAVAVGMVCITLPLIAILAILVKASSRGPLLLRESRVGMNGEPFTMYRFHWMPASGPATGIGKFLCDLGLDRYPQFWNVLRGEMSIVGPSPDRPEFAARLNEAIPFHVQRTAVKPGMTGWAQIQIHDPGTGLVRDAMRRLEYDLYYVKNLSPSLDLSVMLRWLRETLTFNHLATA